MGDKLDHNCTYDNKSWFDWCYIKWDERTDEYPAQIVTFLDLCDCHVIHDDDNDDKYLDEREWVVVRSAKSYNSRQSQNIHGLSLKIAKKYEMENDGFRIVPVTSITRPAFCVYSKEYKDNSSRIEFNLSEHPSEWGNFFVPET